VTDLRDRDDVIDRWLRRAASAPAGPGPNAACLDAEVVAAWADGGLSETALRAVRAHVADCARCQVLAAVMTKLEPATAAAAPAKSSSQRWLGWLVPLAAAAGAVAIWVFIPRQPPASQEGAAPPAPAAQMAQAPGAPAAVSPPPPLEARESVLNAQPAPKLKAERQVAPVDAKRQANEKDQNKQIVANRAEEARDRAQGAADPKKTDVRTLPPPPPAPAAAPPPVGAASTVAAPPPPTSAAMAQASADRVATTAGRGGGGGTRAVGFAESRLTKEIVSTDESTRWRITGGLVEKTTDGGRTWTRVATGVKAEFAAGAAPSPTTCWIVGTAGTVLLTTDGRTWEQLKFPEATDLSAVRATDARTATVTTIDGREFATIDGGNTWIRR
jgi:hypothetical protein